MLLVVYLLIVPWYLFGTLAVVRRENEERSPFNKVSREDFYHEKHNLNYAGNSPKPQLSRRHHIAHFCPNLEKARNCIRQCMKVGKPAFCGKDHKCYCGHKYRDPINKWREQSIDVHSVYGQFKDLYAKYFPPHQRHSKKVTTHKPLKPKPDATPSSPLVGGDGDKTAVADAKGKSEAVDTTTVPETTTAGSAPTEPTTSGSDAAEADGTTTEATPAEAAEAK